MKFKMDGGDLYKVIDGARSIGNDEGVIKFKDDRWLLKTVDESTVLMFAALVPEDSMEYYEKGDTESIGIDFNKFIDGIGSKSSDVEVETWEGGGTHKLKVKQDGYEAGIGLITPDYITGNIDKTPNIEHSVEIGGGLGFLEEFISRADSIIGETSYLISAREEGLYLYATGDTDDMLKKIEWENISDYSIDWSKGTPSSANGINPEEDKRVDTTLPMDYSKSINFVSDNSRIFIDNDIPVKLLFKTDSGVMTSYFISPRIASDDTKIVIPDSAL